MDVSRHPSLPLLTAPSKVRVGVCYKYGRDKDNTVGDYTFKHTFNSEYANAGLTHLK